MRPRVAGRDLELNRRRDDGERATYRHGHLGSSSPFAAAAVKAVVVAVVVVVVVVAAAAVASLFKSNAIIAIKKKERSPLSRKSLESLAIRIRLKVL